MLLKSSLTRELFHTSLSTILILSGIVVAQRAVYIFRLAAKGIIPNDTIETVLVFNLLKHMPLLLSLTIFLTILITISRWYRDSEMIVWFSSGISLKRLVLPIFSFCTPIILLITILSLYISPWAVKKAHEYKSGLKNRDEISTITPGSFKESRTNNRIFYVEGFNNFGKEVRNIFVQTKQNGKLGIIVSKNGTKIINNNEDEYIVLKNGNRYEVAENQNEITSFSFKEYGILMEKEKIIIPAYGPESGFRETVSTFDLLNYGLKNPKSKSDYLAEFWLRISLPISTIILIFLAIAMSYVNPRAGRSMNIILATLCFVIYNNFMGVFQSLVGGGIIPVWLGFIPLHIAFFLLSMYLLGRRIKNLPLTPNFKFKLK